MRFSSTQKLVLSACWLGLSLFANAVALALVQFYPINEKRLDDIVFLLVGEHEWAWLATDAILVLMILTTFWVIMMHAERWMVLQRVFVITGILYMLRAVCISVTLVSPPFRADICIRNGSFLGNLLRYSQTVGLTANHEQILCGDFMFSGHCMIMCICLFTYETYANVNTKRYSYAFRLLCYLGIATVLISRAHYTMDVLVAYWLTSHVFWTYHDCFERRLRVARPPHAANIWWYKLAAWFEQ